MQHDAHVQDALAYWLGVYWTKKFDDTFWMIVGGRPEPPSWPPKPQPYCYVIRYIDCV